MHPVSPSYPDKAERDEHEHGGRLTKTSKSQYNDAEHDEHDAEHADYDSDNYQGDDYHDDDSDEEGYDDQFDNIRFKGE